MLEVILTLLTSYVPESRERLTPVAQAVQEEAAKHPLWGGEQGVLATAAVLVAIAKHEASPRLPESTRRCKVKGDHGKSIGLFQLHQGRAWQGHKADAICQSDGLQARLALDALHWHSDRCPTCSVESWLRGYASGDPGRDSRAARELHAGFLKELKAAGLKLADFDRKGLRAQPR